VARVRVDSGNHPVLGHPPGDPQDPILAIAVEVLAYHGGQQLPSLGNTGVVLIALQGRQQRHRIPSQRVDQRLPGHRIVVVTEWLAAAGVVIIATQFAAQPLFQISVGNPEQAPDCRADQDDGVHRGHRVIHRG
jgi:hypothetical protein